MQEYLYGLACPLEEEVDAIECAVEDSLAAVAAARSSSAAEPPSPSPTASAAAPRSQGHAVPADAAASAAAAQAAQALAGTTLPSLAAPPVAGRKPKAAQINGKASAVSRPGAQGAVRAAHSVRPDAPAATTADGDPATLAAAKAAEAMARVSVGEDARPAKAAAAAAAAAAQAAATMGSSSGRAPSAAATIALERKMAKCVYACVANFDRAAVSDAFATAQRAAGLAEERMQSAKPELHVTLWHKSSHNRERGRACTAADGEKISFEILGFDVSDRISAARVCKLQAQQAPQQVEDATLQKALDVSAPHITLWFASGECLYCSGLFLLCSPAGNMPRC